MRAFWIVCGILALGLTVGALAPDRTASKPDMTTQPSITANPGEETLVLGGGCFWCLEPLYEKIKGVRAVEVGYAGGKTPNPSYEQVCTGATGHAEVVKLVFDPKVIAPEDLLRIFFTMHDPTTKDRQGGDVGTQYRSVVFYANDAGKARAQKVVAEIDAERIWPAPAVTTVEPLTNYSRAEEYHQDYYAKFEKASDVERIRMNSGYCQVIIQPKVLKFREKFAKYLK